MTGLIHAGVRLIVDGETGSVAAAPSPSDEESFLKRKREYESLPTSIAINEKLPCVTEDGIEISLLANIGRPDEVERVAKHSLVGAGLFRTEFRFIESRERPDYQMQLAGADRALQYRTPQQHVRDVLERLEMVEKIMHPGWHSRYDIHMQSSTGRAVLVAGS